MRQDEVNDGKREADYQKHARVEGGRHLPGQCPECERIEGLEKAASALSQVNSNCTALFDALRALDEKYGGCGCFDCASAEVLIHLIEEYRKTGRLPEFNPERADSYFLPDPRFEKIISPDGYPVAQFYTKVMSTETPDPNRFLLDRDTLAGIVERARAEGKPVPQHERALKALDKAI